MRDLISNNLEEYGFDVLKANDAIKGHVMAIKYSPDLILFDLMLSGVYGLTLLRRLRKDEKTTNIPILMMTALGGIKDKIERFTVGADDYITKPFDLEELGKRINALLKITYKNGAIKHLQNPINSDDYDSNNEIGRIYYLRNEYDRSIKSYDKGIKIKPTEYLFLNRGLAKFALGKYQGAINDFSKAIDLNSKCDIYFKNRAFAKYELSRFDSAIKDLDKAIELNPEDSESWSCRGKAKLALKDYKNALVDFEKYKELGSNDEIDELIKTCEEV